MSWTNRIWTEFHAGNLTSSARDVLLTLATYRGTGGIAWPSHTTLADRAGCCVRGHRRICSKTHPKPVSLAQALLTERYLQLFGSDNCRRCAL
jgi:hypothetical protein